MKFGLLSTSRCRVHASRCVYAFIWGIIMGIIAGMSDLFCFSVTNFWLFLVLCFLALGIFWPNYLTILLILIAGVIAGNLRVSFASVGKTYFSQVTNQEITFSGVIMEDPQTDKSPMVVKLKNLQIVQADQTYAVPGVIYAQIGGQVSVQRSDKLTLVGKAQPGFGTYVAKFFLPRIIQAERPEPGDYFLELRNWFANLARKSIPSPEVDLGLGYLMGMKAGIPDSLLTSLQIVGMTHVIVASGAHLGILVNLSKKIFGKISRFAGVLFSLLLILGFVAIVGLTPSMTRASLVSSLALMVGYFGRKFSPLRLISLVAALTLSYEPTNLFNLGWQLSFASFFGILIFAPRFTNFLYGGKKPNFLAELLITSFSTSIICAPILIYGFGNLSLLSFVANLVILPTLPYAMGLIFLTGITAFYPPLASLLGQLTKMLLDLHIGVVHFLEDKTTFVLNFEMGQPAIFLLYLLPLFLLFIFYCSQHLAKRREKCYNYKYENRFRERYARFWQKIRKKSHPTVRD